MLNYLFLIIVPFLVGQTFADVPKGQVKGLNYNIYPVDKRIDPGLPNVESSASGNKVLRITDVHALITTSALADKLSDDCLKLVILANKGQDTGEAEAIGAYHFDDNKICDGSKQIDSWKEELKASGENTGGQMMLLGKMLHSIQDFYSHSNYLEREIEEKKFRLNSGLVVVDLEFKSCEKINSKYFTANNHGETVTSYLRRPTIPPDSHLRDPRSHLYWNKDFDPKNDYYYSAIFSRSALKEFEGRRYFDIIFDVQVAHTKKLYDELSQYLSKNACD